MLNTRVEEKYDLRGLVWEKVCLRKFGHNGPGIDEKKYIMDSCFSF